MLMTIPAEQMAGRAAAWAESDAAVPRSPLRAAILDKLHAAVD
jgi:hypothetical protein